MKRNREHKSFEEFTSPTARIDDLKEAIIEENLSRTSEGLRDLGDVALEISEGLDSESPMLEEIHYKADQKALRVRKVTNKLDEF